MTLHLQQDIKYERLLISVLWNSEVSELCMIPKMKGAGDSCGTMTSDITTTASPTIPSATPSRPVAIPDYLRKGTGAGSSPRGSPHTPGSSPGGSSIGCSPRGSHRRNLHRKLAMEEEVVHLVILDHLFQTITTNHCFVKTGWVKMLVVLPKQPEKFTP